VLDNPSDQGSIWQDNTFVSVSHCHHRGSDQGAIIDGGLNQESIETVSPLHCDHRVAQNREYLAGQDVVNASYVIAEVAQLKAALSLSLHLVRAPSVKHSTNSLRVGR
jgi:hypothetical protein